MPAGPVDHVLGGQRGVSGAEGEEPVAGGDGVGDEEAGLRDVRGLLVPHPFQQTDGGVEELTGQLALAHTTMALPEVGVRPCPPLTVRSGPRACQYERREMSGTGLDPRHGTVVGPMRQNWGQGQRTQSEGHECPD